MPLQILHLLDLERIFRAFRTHYTSRTDLEGLGCGLLSASEFIFFCRVPPHGADGITYRKGQVEEDPEALALTGLYT